MTDGIETTCFWISEVVGREMRLGLGGVAWSIL